MMIEVQKCKPGFAWGYVPSNSCVPFTEIDEDMSKIIKGFHEISMAHFDKKQSQKLIKN